MLNNELYSLVKLVTAVVWWMDLRCHLRALLVLNPCIVIKNGLTREMALDESVNLGLKYLTKSSDKVHDCKVR